MVDYWIPGQRPQGLWPAVGSLLLASFALPIAWFLVTLLLGMGSIIWAGEALSGNILAGSVYVVALGAMTAALFMVSTRRWPRLHWAAWWVLIAYASSRLFYSAAVMVGLARGLGWGFDSYVSYDFAARPATHAAGIALGAVAMLATAFGIRRGERELETLRRAREGRRSASNKRFEPTP